MTRPEPFWEKNNNIPNQIVVGTSLKVQIATLRHMLCRGWCLNRGMPRAATPENSSKGLRKHDFHFGTSYDLCTELYDHDYPSVKHVTKLNSIYLLTLYNLSSQICFMFFLFAKGPQKKGRSSSHRTIFGHVTTPLLMALRPIILPSSEACFEEPRFVDQGSELEQKSDPKHGT